MRSGVQIDPRHLVLIAVCLGVSGAGCRSKQPPTSQPGTSAKPALTLIAPESLKWSREEACARLSDEKLGLSAAVRLVRLAEVSPPCVPAELTDEHVSRLRLVRLSEQRWALGLADKQSNQRLHAPVLISEGGDVTLPVEGTEEEVAVLHVSQDADIFPHLLLLPDRVLLVGERVVTAIVLEPEQEVRFALREQKGHSYIGLMLDHAGEAVEVARYIWDPYELSFAGPAVQKLPDPPGGKLHVDLEASERLVPLGGEIPEPKPNRPPRQGRPPRGGGDDGA